VYASLVAALRRAHPLAASLIAALVIATPAFAQGLGATYRVEVGRRDRGDVVPMGEAGALLVLRDAGGTAWHLQWLDPALQPGWTDAFDPGVALELADWDVEGGRAWIALGNRAGRVFVLQVDPLRGVIEARQEAPPARLRAILGLAVAGQDLYLSGRSKLAPDSAGWLLHRGVNGGDLHEVDLGELLPSRRILVSEPTKVDGVPQVVATTPKTRRRSMAVVTLGEGNITSSRVFPPDGAHTLLTGTSVHQDAWDLVVGTYGDGAGYGAQGLFVFGARGGAEVFREYHSFSTLHDFFSYLPQRRQERVRARAKAKAARGGDLSLNYAVVLDEVQVHGDALLVVAEAYVPVYHTEPRTETVIVGGRVTTTTTYVQVFDGWHPTHGFVADFDLTGALRWDATVDIGWGLVPRLEPHMRVQVEGDSVRMVYPIADRLYTRVVTNGVVESADAAQSDYRAVDEGDVRAAWGTDSAAWYGDRFLVWGQQRVREEDGKKRVFAVTELRP